jgi:predicted dehydrogenase
MTQIKMRAVVVGAGVVAGFWIAPLRRRAEVVAVVEVDDERGRDALARLQLDCRGFSSLDEALSTVPADVVVNLTPPEHHRRVTEQALDAGCHVLMLLDMAFHTFDQARFLSGAEAIEVVCHEFTAPHSWYAGPAAAVATFELEDGVMFSYRGNWISAGFPTSYDSAWRISGADGTAVWDGFGAPACEVVAGPPPERGAAEVRRTTWDVPPPLDRTGHVAGVDDLFDALEAGERPETEGVENLGTLAMVFAAIRSAEQRRTVSLEEIVGGQWPPRRPQAA